jgi:hypothetical protein
MTDARGLAVQAVALRALAQRVTQRLDTIKGQLAYLIGPGDRTTARLDDGRSIGSISYAKGKVAATVVDEVAFTRWVLANYPHNITQAVRPAFTTAVLESSRRAGVPMAPDGTLEVPGVEVRDGAPYLTVRPDHDAITVAVDAVRAALELAIDELRPPAVEQ